MRRGALAALLLSLVGCDADPYATMRGADLHIVVKSLSAQATQLQVELRGADDLVISRGPRTAGLSRLDVYFLDLPAGRYTLRARALDASSVEMACADYGADLDTAAAPLDVTLDMLADACGANSPDAAFRPDATVVPPDAAFPPDFAGPGRPDAEEERDHRMGPPPRDDARVGERKDARNEDEDDEQR